MVEMKATYAPRVGSQGGNVSLKELRVVENRTIASPAHPDILDISNM